MHSDLYRCRVCGLEQDDPPWGEDGLVPTFEICVCCGSEFGYEDATLAGVLRKRAAWLAAGAKWESPRFKPDGWDLNSQLDCIPIAYRK
ncbi:hypothetical protein EJC51_46085 [Streptomyces aquilus]|uniref:Uncharacterized protein n=1 Tax=Streptomyces aquilus TaxID=2548456 RepID=A0A3Q9C640_9ACTN|nr:hypothetical protein EJC51_46085 [Streptomyces aquilus]